MKILIVDDSAFMRNMIKNILKDHEINEAGNAEEAVQKYNEFKPDLVFLDVVLPGKNGVEILKDIKGIIEGSGLSKDVKDKSIQIFESIAREEGKIHNCSPEEIFFHEIGGIDSIMDIT